MSFFFKYLFPAQNLSLPKLDRTRSKTSLELWCDWQRVVLKRVRPFLPLIIDWCLFQPMKPLGFSVVNCIWKWSIFLEFVASYHTCLNTCLRRKTEDCQPFTNQPWSLSSLSLEREAQLVASLQSQGLCGVPCGVPWIQINTHPCSPLSCR